MGDREKAYMPIWRRRDGAKRHTGFFRAHQPMESQMESAISPIVCSALPIALFMQRFFLGRMIIANVPAAIIPIPMPT